MNVILPAVFMMISGVSSRYLKCPGSEGKYPIENSLCKSYYVCENWKVANEHSCPPDQNFDPVKQRCEYEELYYCAEAALKQYKLCKKSTGKFPKEKSSCRSYYQCEKWKVTGEFTCPPGENFNPAQQMCDWEEVYPCLEDKLSKKCPKLSGFFPVPGSKCKRFNECINGKAYELECPDDLVFDPHFSQCEWPELYQCEDTEGSTASVATKTSWVTTTTPISSEETSRDIDKTERIRTTIEYVSTRVSTEGTEADTIKEESTLTGEDFTATSTWKTPENTETTEGFDTLETSRDTETEETVSHSETSTSAPTREISQYSETESTVHYTGRTFIPTTGQTSQVTQTEGIVVTTGKYITASTGEGSTWVETEGTKRTNVDNITVTTRGTSTNRDETAKSTVLSTKETSQETGTGEEYTSPVTPETTEINEFDTTHSTGRMVSDFETTMRTSDVDSRERTILSTAPGAKSTASNTVTRTSTMLTSHETDSVPTEISGRLVCPGATGLFPHPTNKHKFLSCLEFVPTEMDCPNDLIYEPKLEACVWNKLNRV